MSWCRPGLTWKEFLSLVRCCLAFTTLVFLSSWGNKIQMIFSNFRRSPPSTTSNFDFTICPCWTSKSPTMAPSILKSGLELYHDRYLFCKNNFSHLFCILAIVVPVFDSHNHSFDIGQYLLCKYNTLYSRRLAVVCPRFTKVCWLRSVNSCYKLSDQYRNSLKLKGFFNNQNLKKSVLWRKKNPGEVFPQSANSCSWFQEK